MATTNTGAFFSCSQVTKLPKTRAAVPASLTFELPTPENPFSISSTHSRHGAMDSATRIAVRKFSSDEPTRLAKRRPTSRRSSGRRQAFATALAINDLPEPWTPTSKMPRGSGRPKSRASLEKARTRLRSHSLSTSRPPTSVSVSEVS